MNQKKKEKYGTEKSQRLLHDHNFSKNRKLLQDAKKKGCPVIFSTKKILSFPEFKIPNNTSNNKDKASKLIKTFLNDLKEAKDKKATMKQCKFEYIVTFPKAKHLYHHTGIAAGVTEPLDPRVNDFIKKLIRSWFSRVKELKSRAADFVTDILFEGASKPDRYRGRFFPERRKIRNLTTYIKTKNRFSKFDQENVENFVSTCQQAKIRFTPRYNFVIFKRNVIYGLCFYCIIFELQISQVISVESYFYIYMGKFVFVIFLLGWVYALLYVTNQ